MANAKFTGKDRYNAQRKVVSLRTRKLMSWADIAEQLDVAPRTARKLFQERAGEHQHHDHLPDKGGRFPSGQYTEDAIILWTPQLDGEGDAPVLDGTGYVHEWVRTEISV